MLAFSSSVNFDTRTVNEKVHVVSRATYVDSFRKVLVVVDYRYWAVSNDGRIGSDQSLVLIELFGSVVVDA